MEQNFGWQTRKAYGNEPNHLLRGKTDPEDES